MCAFFDASWQYIIGFLLFASIVTMLLRIKYSDKIAAGGSTKQPQWLAALVFWGSGIVGISMLALMILGFVCAGSPGEIPGIVPN